MTGSERFSIGLTAILMASLSLVMGLLIRKRKPVLISPKIVWRGISLISLPYLIYLTLKLIVESLNSDYVLLSLAASLLEMLLIMTPLLLITFVLLLASLGRAWMHIKGKRRIQNYKGLDFGQALAEMQYNGHTAEDLFFLIAAVLIVSVVFWAIF